MKRKTLVILVSSLAVLILFSGAVFAKILANGEGPAQASANTGGPKDAKDNESDYTYIPPTPVDQGTNDISPSPTPIEEAFVPATEMDLDPSSITVFVNKEYALPRDYRPDDLVTPDVIFNLVTYDERTLMRKEAAQALEQLFAAAQQEGHILYGVSAYRSYDRQKTIFLNNIVTKGKDYTLRYSAVPGTSEHQTGLAIDVSVKSQNFRLDDNFGSSPEGIWLAANAHNYGYIIRYPKGFEDITGYAFEPWHIRYVGKALATYLYENNLTLEDYYHYVPSEDFDFEATYASLINYKPPTVTPTPLPEDVVIGEDGEITDIGDNGEIIDDPLDETDQDGDDSHQPGSDPDTKDDGSSSDDKEDSSNDDSEDTDSEQTKDEGEGEGEAPAATITPLPTPTLAPTLTPTPDPGQSENITP